MKNYFCFMVLIIVSFSSLNSCATTRNDLFGLDAAINETAKIIKDNLPQGTKVAVVNFTSSSPAFSEYVIEELSIALAGNRKLVVVDRRELDLIRNEMDFQLSGVVDDNSISSIGRILGAQYIITGSFADAGTYYRLRANAVNVENAAKEAPVSLRINRADGQINHFFPNVNTQNNAVPGLPSNTQSPSVQNIIHSFKVKNSTGYDGYQLHVGLSGTNMWSDDLLDYAEVYIIDNGDTEEIRLENPLNGAIRYDLRLIRSYSDGNNTYTKRNILITSNIVIEFTRADLDR